MRQGLEKVKQKLCRHRQLVELGINYVKGLVGLRCDGCGKEFVVKCGPEYLKRKPLVVATERVDDEGRRVRQQLQDSR